MDSNPHETPTDFGDVLNSGTSAKCPRGIAILSVLAIIGGIVLLVLPIAFAAVWEGTSAAFTEMGFPPVLFLVAVVFLAILTLASGIGMWRGLKWGWWLGCFYYVYAVLRNGWALYTIAEMSDALAASERSPEYYYTKHSVRIAFSALIILYFFKRSVLEYFGLTDINKLKALGVLVLICTGILVSFTVSATLPRSGRVSFATDYAPMEFSFPVEWYADPEDDPYDLQCFSKFQTMNTGVVAFKRLTKNLDGSLGNPGNSGRHVGFFVRL